MVRVYNKAFHKKENQVLNPSSQFQVHILICDPVLLLEASSCKMGEGNSKAAFYQTEGLAA